MQEPTMKTLLAALCLIVLTTPEAKSATCSASSSGISFGSFDVLASGSRDTLGTITIRCYGNVGEKVTYSIALNRITLSSQNRTLLSGNNQLSYALFVDPSRTQSWGDGTGGTSVLSDSFYLDQTETNRPYTIYARIPGGQTTNPAGSYNDTATIILSY
jgi:spore coat protein U-like protein